MTRFLSLALAAGLGLVATAGQATNGLYLTGYGAEALGRGGANVAISDRTLGLNANPAGIAQLQGNHFTLGLAVLAPQLELETTGNPATAAEDRFFPLPAFGWVRSGKETPWAFGLGFVAQGGMGATFEDLNTPFGTRDGTYTQVRFATLSPTVAYAFSENAAIGATLNLGWADAAFRVFPDTSFLNPREPNQSFFGLKMEDASGLQTSLRVGAWWRPAERWTLGAMYQTKTESTFEDGTLRVNFGAHPALTRKVNYDAEMEGFTFAAQAGVGVAVEVTDRLLLAFDLKRYFWEDAIDTIIVRGTNPETPNAPPVLTVPFVFEWQDQWVVSLGAEYRMGTTTLRAGYNYGENPVPDDTLTPLFPATVEHHLSIGASFLSGSTTYEVAVERAFNASNTNHSPDPSRNPFGPGTRVDHEQWTLAFAISWAKARAGH